MKRLKRYLVPLMVVLLMSVVSIFGVLTVQRKETIRNLENTLSLKEIHCSKQDALLLEKETALSSLKRELSDLTASLNAPLIPTSNSENYYSKKDSIYTSVNAALLSKHAPDEIQVMPIYSGDIDDYSPIIEKCITVPSDAPLIDKLNLLSQTLSSTCFKGLSIDVLSLEEVHGKRVAYINLSDSHTGDSPTWESNYFGGSAVGTTTCTSLLNTFFQKEYGGEWIDGVRFLCNGTPPYFDHIPCNISDGIVYRDFLITEENLSPDDFIPAEGSTIVLNDKTNQIKITHNYIRK